MASPSGFESLKTACAWPFTQALALFAVFHDSPRMNESKHSGHRRRGAELWSLRGKAFHHSGKFKEGCFLAVNLGDGGDITGAVYGQLSGAFYGIGATPKSRLKAIFHKDLIAEFTLKLRDASGFGA